MSAVTARLRLAAQSVSTARSIKTTSICASYVSHPHRRPYSSSTHPARSPALALKRKPEHTPAPATEEPQEPASSSAQGMPRATAGERDVFVHWDGAEFARFHHLWLRDHCRCPECFHPITKQRLLNTFDIPSDVEPAEVRPKAEGLEVVWHPASRPHTSFYPWSWLRHNAYDPPRWREAAEKVLWGSKIEKEPPTVAYEDVMAPNGRGLFTWLSKIDKFGFCFVSGVPPTPEATEELSAKIGFIRETHYGKFWDFTADLARSDTAYTNLALPAHTDNTYFTDPCGIQLFHLLSHTGGSGGATLLVDGFYVASIIQDLHPNVYKLLSDVPVPAHAAGEDGVLYRASAPVLGHDVGSGALRRVRWNNDDRSVVRDVPAKDMLRWYDAIKTWNKALTAPDSEYWVQLTPGTVIAIDNHRVLHGRSAFDGSRRMCGAYIGGDEFRSKLAVLAERFAASKLELDGEGKDGRSVWSGDF